jgi:type II secretory pathway pseudopilin PulG
MKKRGFELIEVLVSAALLLFMIGATAQLLMVSLTAKKGADFAFAAARRASVMLEHDKSLAFNSPELEPGTSSPAVEDAAFPLRLEATRRVEAIDEDTKRIIVVISDRNSPQKKQTYCLTLCRELGF